jgi:membrane-bound metal-dependent hydrolase YbcI (DUF457 family)
MPDLLTHYVSARLPGGFIADPAARMTFIFGVFLPDFGAKGIELILNLPDHTGAPTHSIAGLFVLTYALALLFTPEFRFKAWTTMFAGSILHVLVDMAKDNLGKGSANLLHPFALDGFEFGLYYNENILYLLPTNVIAVWAMWWIAKKAQKRGWVWR